MSSVPRHASAAINHPTLPTDHAIPPVNSTSPAIPITSPLAPPAKTAPATTLPSTIAPAPPTSPSEPSHPLSPSEPDEQAAGTITPPVPLVHLRVLVISGESHVFTFEPELAVGRMKELIWSMWPSDWTAPAQPPSPSFLRVLHAGRVLSDDSTLASNNLAAAIPPTIPTVIHLSVRSFSIRAEDDPKKPSLLHPVGSRSHNTGANEAGGCKCVIM